MTKTQPTLTSLWGPVLVTLTLLVLSAGLIASPVSGRSLPPNGAPPVHLLRGATGTAGPRMEVFVNGSSSFTWEPAVLNVPSNASVVFVIGIVGTLPHNFTLDSISNDTNLSTSMTFDHLYGYFNAHKPLVDVPNLNLSGPAWVTAPVPMPKHGVFEYVCEYPGHFQQGMFGYVYVGMPAPATPSTQFSLNLIQLDALVILSVAVVLVVFLYATRRSRGPRQKAGEVEGAQAQTAHSPPPW